MYDEHGIYSSPRAWWLFKTFGHEQVAVLDGGLPAWQAANFPTEEKQVYQGPKGNFKASYQPTAIKTYRDVYEAIDKEYTMILDARSQARFSGLSPEPRAGLRSGHIPSSINLPYSNVLNKEQMKSKQELSALFKPYDQSELIMSCGSGITACIIALGAEIAGHSQLSVYDGSWTEWGSNESLPIETSSN